MTLQDWMNRGGQHRNPGRNTMTTPEPAPAPEPAPNPRTDPQGTWSAAPDSEWLGEWAMIALSVGRLELGYQLARLARAAQRCEHHLAQHATPADPPADPPADLAPEPTSPAPDQTAVIIPGPATAAAAAAHPRQVTPSGSCCVPVNGGRLCHAVAFYDSDARRWVHLDPAIDQDHQANVPPEAYNNYDHQG